MFEKLDPQKSIAFLKDMQIMEKKIIKINIPYLESLFTQEKYVDKLLDEMYGVILKIYQVQ